mgnify:CR=1 FL=1
MSTVIEELKKFRRAKLETIPLKDILEFLREKYNVKLMTTEFEELFREHLSKEKIKGLQRVKNDN